MRLQFAGLWRHPGFLKLWVGQTISIFGSAITGLALPLAAVLLLDAGPAQMGLLGAADFAPFLLVGLFAGVWVDRLSRRRVLIAGDVGRALLLLTIPLAALLGALRMEQLYVVGFLTGVLTVFFDVAYQSFLPSLVQREQLVEGNSKLEVSRSVGNIAGPGLAGALVQLVTAPLAILLDALSFLVSACFLAWIRAPEVVRQAEQRRSMWNEIGEGLRIVLGNPLLRSIAGCTGTSNLFSSTLYSLYVLYVTRELGVTPALLGLVFSVGSAGGLLGALLAGRAARTFRLGPTIVVSGGMTGVATLLILLARGPLFAVVPLLAAAQFLVGLGVPIYNINQVSLRQAICPHRLQGRMNATMRFIVWGTLPIGALIGGALGERIGLWPTMAVGAIGMLLAPLWVYFSPVRSLREQPAPLEEPARAAGAAG